MNYRHAYHAGNFADVFKHIILIALIQSLLKKATPFCYLETHAGAGIYDLGSEQAQKTKEFANGIEKIISADNRPIIVEDYLRCVKTLNENDIIAKYPGSPLFARQWLRPNDRMVLSELHPEEYHKLKQLFVGDKQVAIHHLDGYQSLKAFLPPKEKRGLVLIDPPYENLQEYNVLLKKIQELVTRWPTGIFALWYPIKNRNQINVFLSDLQKNIARPQLVSELNISPHLTNQLCGCGMLIINPPWEFEALVSGLTLWLQPLLAIN